MTKQRQGREFPRWIAFMALAGGLLSTGRRQPFGRIGCGRPDAQRDGRAKQPAWRGRLLQAGPSQPPRSQSYVR